MKRQRSRLHLTTLLALVLSGCNQDQSPSAPSPPPKILSYVSGAATAFLQADGTFLPEQGDSPDGTPIITESRARQLAMAYVRTYGASFHSAWERQRGTAIDMTALKTGERVYFAHTPYAAVPKGLHPAIKKTYGPYYLVPLEANGVAVIMMAVSAYNTDLNISASGQLLLPALGGMGFIHSALPISPARYAVVSPEEAVSRAYGASHVKVTTRPELMLIGRHKSPLLAAWQLKLEHGVKAREHGSGKSRLVESVLVGPREKDRYQIEAENEPVTESDAGPTVINNTTSGPTASFVVTVQPGRHVKVQSVDFGTER